MKKDFAADRQNILLSEKSMRVKVNHLINNYPMLLFRILSLQVVVLDFIALIILLVQPVRSYILILLISEYHLKVYSSVKN